MCTGLGLSQEKRRPLGRTTPFDQIVRPRKKDGFGRSPREGGEGGDGGAETARVLPWEKSINNSNFRKVATFPSSYVSNCYK